jgi:pyrroline-5-carboxylate reductase
MNIGFIGSGNMTTSIVSGMLKNDFNAKDIYLSDRDAEQLAKKQQQFGVNTAQNIEIFESCPVIFLAVKPQNIEEVAYLLPAHTTTTIVSIAAGISTARLQKLFGTTRIIRAMPNTPSMVGLGATGLFALTEKNYLVEKIFDSIGISVWVEEEEQIDTITALSGSGPAYFYMMFEAMISSAVAAGIDYKIAKKLCLQTAMGASVMAKIEDPKILREQVTSKGGTTAAALEVFQHHGFEDIINKAMNAAKNRAYELSANL